MSFLNRFALLLLVAGFVGGCTLEKDIKNWGKQNPLGEKPDDIQNGEPPQKPVKKTPAIPVDAIRIDSPVEEFQFTEGAASDYSISFRILNPEVMGVLSFDGLEQLEGASFDPVKGVLHWQPKDDLVKKEGKLLLRSTIKAVVTTDAENAMIAERTFQVVVYRALSTPRISSMGSSDLLESIVEGENRIFTVEVHDTDSTEALPPRIEIFAPDVVKRSAYANGAAYTSCGSAVKLATLGDWAFRCKVETKDLELTRDVTRYYFAMRAASGQGLVSAIRENDFSIETNVSEPVWSEGSSNFKEVTFKRRKLNEFGFFVMDPKMEGQIEVTVDPKDLPSNGTLPKEASCKSVNSDAHVSYCVLKWNPPAQSAEKFLLIFSARNSSPNSSSSLEASQKFHLVIGLNRKRTMGIADGGQR